MYSGVPEAEKPAYDPKIWTNQTDAIELVLATARLIARRKPADRRVIIFRGRRGAGKTWLLHRLEELLKTPEFGKLDIHFLDLETPYDLNDLQQLLDSPRPQVLLLDNVNQASDQDLDILEDRALAPLASRPDTLIVMAEGGPAHFWASPLFREQSAEPDLEAFGRCDIEDQVRKIEAQNPGLLGNRSIDVDLVESYGGGFPWSTYILTLYLPDRKQALERCVAALLGGVDDDLWPPLMALCVLKGFDEALMAEFLPHYPPLGGTEWDMEACRDLRQRLLKTNLVGWHPKMRSYAIDEPVRLALEACLSQNAPGRWTDLHCAAYRLYGDWADKYPQVRGWWQALQTHHRTCLVLANFDPADCPQQLALNEEETDGD